MSGWAMDFRGRKISFHAPLPWCIPFAATPCMRWWQIRCKKISKCRGAKKRMLWYECVVNVYFYIFWDVVSVLHHVRGMPYAWFLWGWIACVIYAWYMLHTLYQVYKGAPICVQMYGARIRHPWFYSMMHRETVRNYSAYPSPTTSQVLIEMMMIMMIIVINLIIMIILMIYSLIHSGSLTNHHFPLLLGQVYTQG